MIRCLGFPTGMVNFLDIMESDLTLGLLIFDHSLCRREIYFRAIEYRVYQNNKIKNGYKKIKKRYC